MTRVVYLSDGKIQMDIPMRELTDYSEQKMEKLGLRSINADFQSQINKSDWSPPSQNEPDTITLKDYVFAYDVKTILDIRNLQIPRNEVIAITVRMEPENQHLSDVFVDYRKKFKGRTVINSKEYKPKINVETVLPGNAGRESSNCFVKQLRMKLFWAAVIRMI